MCIAWLGSLQGCKYDDGILWVVLIIFPIFFAFWNTGCSQLIIVPMLRWYWFGFHDQMANNAIKGAICPHWIIGIIVPTIMAGLPGFIFAVVIPYSYCIYKFNKYCKAEAQNGLLIKVRNEVDVFVNGKKTLRISDNTVRRDKNGLYFEFEGKSYGSITVKKHSKTKKYKVKTEDIIVATGIGNFFTAKPEALQGANYAKSYEFANHNGDKVALKYTSFVGNESIAMAEASLLAESTLLERQNSFSDNIVRAFTGTNNAPDQHFVATALYFEPVNNSRRSVAPNILNDGNNNRNFNSAV